MSSRLCGCQRLVKDGYCFRDRQSERRGECERTRGGSERGVQKAENKRNRNLKATMKQSIRNWKKEKIKERTRQNRREWKEIGKITEDDRVKVKWRKLEADNEGDWWWKWRERERIQLYLASRSHMVSSYVSVMFWSICWTKLKLILSAFSAHPQ